MKPPLPFARLALLMGGLAAFTAASAQQSPYYFGASQGFTRDSNLFRRETNKESDVISTTSLFAGIDQPISRQRLFGDVAVHHNRYRDNDDLNNTAYELKGGIDWATVNRLSGTISYSLGNRLDIVDNPTGTDSKNMERSQQFLARGRLGGTSRLALEATYLHRRVDYSDDDYAPQEFQQNTVGFGAQYRPSGLLAFGAGVRVTRGKYPDGIIVSTAPLTTQSDDYDRHDLDLTAVWTPSGLSTLSARISYSKEEHDLDARDVSGFTGALSWDYKPTGKLSFTTDLIRDTGAESNFIVDANTATGDYTSRSRISNTAQVRARYAATGKIGINAFARYTDRDLGADASDKTTFLNLGADYAVLRSVLLNCSIGYEKRTVDGTASVPYTANVVGCTARLTLR